MYRLMLVDDEPLALIGMKSILDYPSLNIELVGTATNGKAALELIEEWKPDIVVTDIRMPVMDGLEMIARCRERCRKPPRFIVLTSYEDFAYARESVRLHASDYLVKMELNGETMRRSLEKVIDEMVAAGEGQNADTATGDVFLNRFLSRLLGNVFISGEEIDEQLSAFRVNLDADAYVAAAAEISPKSYGTMDLNGMQAFYQSVMGTLKTSLEKRLQCRLVAYSQTQVGIIVGFGANWNAQGDPAEGWMGSGTIVSTLPVSESTHESEAQMQKNRMEAVGEGLRHAGGLCRKYLGVELRFGIGRVVRTKHALHESYADAQHALREQPESEICQWSGTARLSLLPDMTPVNRAMVVAMETCDEALFNSVFARLGKLAGADDLRMEDAIDLVSGVVHLIIGSVDEGKDILAGAFPDAPRAHLAIYGCQRKSELVRCLDGIGAAVRGWIRQQNSQPKNRMVLAAQQYIRQHVQEKLTLGQVAAAINVSPNYLSTLFRKFGGAGFNEYVLTQKVQKAQELLAERRLKVYQVSEMLGFESAYYFSSVYKRMTGHSPSGEPAGAAAQGAGKGDGHDQDISDASHPETAGTGRDMDLSNP